jgi:hypothetical protein
MAATTSLNIRLPHRVKKKLSEQAARAGQSVGDYASRLLGRAAAASDVDAILAPLRAEFAASGTTQDQLLAQINKARDEYHSTRRKSKSH